MNAESMLPPMRPWMEDSLDVCRCEAPGDSTNCGASSRNDRETWWQTDSHFMLHSSAVSVQEMAAHA